MKSEKGITLIVLIISLILIVVLAGVAISSGNDSIESMKLQNFNYELQQIQGKVDVIYEKIKLGENEYITLGSNITDSKKAMETLKKVTGIDYENFSNEEIEEYYYDETYTTYRYLTESQLKEKLNISSQPGDVIINFLKREVISVNGFEYNNEIYYSLND